MKNEDDETMTIKRFLDLWNDRNLERSVVIVQKEVNCLTVIFNFPPNVVAVGKMDLCVDPMLHDPL